MNHTATLPERTRYMLLCLLAAVLLLATGPALQSYRASCQPHRNTRPAGLGGVRVNPLPVTTR